MCAGLLQRRHESVLDTCIIVVMHNYTLHSNILYVALGLHNLHIYWYMFVAKFLLLSLS